MTSHDDERLNLTALDPTLDAMSFERSVRATVAAAMARHQRTTTTEALRWWRPALALAASLALAAWLPVLLGGGADEPATASRTDPALELLTLARADATPSPTEILTTFGASR